MACQLRNGIIIPNICGKSTFGFNSSSKLEGTAGLIKNSFKREDLIRPGQSNRCWEQEGKWSFISNQESERLALDYKNPLTMSLSLVLRSLH